MTSHSPEDNRQLRDAFGDIWYALWRQKGWEEMPTLDHWVFDQEVFRMYAEKYTTVFSGEKMLVVEEDIGQPDIVTAEAPRPQAVAVCL